MSGAVSPADAALALIKPEVRAQTAYTLDAPRAARKLNQNESPFDAPEVVKQAVIRAMRDEPWNRYPPFTPTELLERLAARHAWVASGVLVGNGSNELIQATLAVTVGEGTAVVTPTPTFSLYRLLAAVYGGRHVPVALTADFQFDVDALVRAARDTQAPLAGLRFGYALAHPAVAAEIAKARLPYNVNRVTLAAAHAALDAADVLAERARAVRLNRDALAGRLARIPGLRAFPSAANFVLIRCVARPAAEVFRRLVEEHGILVRDVSGAVGLEGCLRITAGTAEDVDAVARALHAILA